MTQDPDIDRLFEMLGHSFTDVGLLRQALTHPSVETTDHYQRLEFLGDRVLGLIMADTLYRKFPDLREGDLARRFNSLVKRDTLAGIAKAAGLDRHLVLGRGADDEGVRTKPAILSDICEAVIAALYLDGGIDAARRFVDAHWGVLVTQEIRGNRDPKSALQEWAQGRGLPPPEYVELDRSGPDHALQFTVEVRLSGQRPMSGSGQTKRLAEKNAARAMLKGIDHG